MRVLRVIGGLDVAFGGPSVSAVNSVLAAQRQGLATDLVFPGRGAVAELGEAGVQRLADAGVNVTCFRYIGTFRRVSRSMGISTELARWLWRHARDYDIIHVHSPWVLPTFVAVLAARRAQRAVVLTPHEGLTRFDVARSHSWLFKLLKVRLGDFYGRNLDAVVFSSDLELRDSTTRTMYQTGIVIRHPIFDENHEQSVLPARRSNWSGTPLRLGFLGRLVPKKNLNRLIESLAALPNNVSLQVAGEGTQPYTDELKRLAHACGVHSRIAWLGFVRGPEKDRFLEQTD